ncbi:MAG: acyltransferase domain-containing protein, partial [Symploca sp. SIO1C4]|nr:acyltransferase domain-containing protein [Symploca sp. SIO1C4]
APPRRAGVSSFGFGGTNYHIVLEEYQDEQNQVYRLNNTPQPLLLQASTPEQLLRQCQELLSKLQSECGDKHYQELIDQCESIEIPLTNSRVGFIADSLTEASHKLQITIDWLQNKPQLEAWEHPQGLFFRKVGVEIQGKVVALFSGQGSQYLNMGQELAINFPQLRQAYSYMDSLMLQDGLKPISEVVFPNPVFEPAQEAAQLALLQRTEYAQPAIGCLSAGIYKLLQQAGFKPDFVAGHSFGELTALWAAEVLSDEDYFFLVKARGQAMATPDDLKLDAGTMLAVKGDVSKIKAVVKDFPQVTIANWNSNQQVVLAGVKSEIEQLQPILKEQGYHTVPLPVSAAFHTSLVAHSQEPFAKAVVSVTAKSPTIPVYTNVTGQHYPTGLQAIQENLQKHLSNPVFFKQEIENIYAQGGYCFIEFGPKNVLTNLVKDILSDKPHLAIALNANRQKDSDRQLREAVMQLRVAGLPLQTLDPYQQLQPVPEAETDPRHKLLNVRLRGTNYLSDKTKKTFEQVLNDGYQVKVTSPQTEATVADTREVLEKAFQNGHHQPSSQPQSEEIAVVRSSSPLATTNTSANTPKPIQTQPMSTPSVNYQRVLESFEYSIAQINQHQGETMQVHGQYLNHQMEYARIFFHLMQQQANLFVNGNSANQPIETQLAVLASLERSMIKFQEHQAGTLRVHEQTLNHQVEYAKNLFRLTQQQCQMLMGNAAIEYHLEPTESVANVAAIEESSSSPALNASVSELVMNSEQDTSNNHSSPAVPAISVPSTPLPMVMDTVAPSPEKVFSNGNGSKPVSESPVPATRAMVMDTVAPSPEKVFSNGNGSQPVAEVTVPAKVEPVKTVTETPAVGLDIDFDTLKDTLLEVVADKTGYPPEMLELDMDMEADLGIDSIKRVEILGAIQDKFPGLPKPDLEELAEIEMRTLAQVIDFIKELAQGGLKKKELQPA